VEVILKLDQTMLRYPECVWSGAEELEHIELSEGTGKCQKTAEDVRSCGRHWKLQKTLEGVGKHWKLQNVWLVTGKILEGLYERSGDVTVCDNWLRTHTDCLIFVFQFLMY